MYVRPPLLHFPLALFAFGPGDVVKSYPWKASIQQIVSWNSRLPWVFWIPSYGVVFRMFMNVVGIYTVVLHISSKRNGPGFWLTYDLVCWCSAMFPKRCSLRFGGMKLIELLGETNFCDSAGVPIIWTHPFLILKSQELMMYDDGRKTAFRLTLPLGCGFKNFLNTIIDWMYSICWMWGPSQNKKKQRLNHPDFRKVDSKDLKFSPGTMV